MARASSSRPVGPRYRIFIPSKGRWESLFTMKALDKIGVDYTVVVEPQEADRYAKAVGAERLLVMPHSDKGLAFTRNWIWDYARDHGYPRFWTIDDNIGGFYRFNRNLKVPVTDGAILRAAEDFAERYTNVPIAGLNYFMFAPRKAGHRINPFDVNKRVYSNMLIRTNYLDPHGYPYRNETFYNDDTDLCLRVLKDGNCTILFNAFLVEKKTTMTVRGGMTPHYQEEGRWNMAEELRRAHPDVTTITRKWGRWQHQVNYRPFKANKLRRRKDLDVEDGVDNYGMKLIKLKQGGGR